MRISLSVLTCLLMLPLFLGKKFNVKKKEEEEEEESTRGRYPVLVKSLACTHVLKGQTAL